MGARGRWDAAVSAGTLPCPLVRFEAAVPRPAGTGAAGAGATATASAGATATVQVPPTLPAPGSPPLLPLLPHHRNYGGGAGMGAGAFGHRRSSADEGQTERQDIRKPSESPSPPNEALRELSLRVSWERASSLTPTEFEKTQPTLPRRL